MTNSKALSGVTAVAAPAPTANHNGDANHDDDKMAEVRALCTPVENNYMAYQRQRRLSRSAVLCFHVWVFSLPVKQPIRYLKVSWP